MRTNYLGAGHIRSFIAEGCIRVVAPTLAGTLSGFLAGLPWAVNRLAWETIGVAVKAPLGEIQDPLFVSLVQRVRTEVPQLILVYSDLEAVVGETKWVLEHLDELVWGAAGPRYLVGASDGPEGPVPQHEVVLEFDGVETVRAGLP